MTFASKLSFTRGANARMRHVWWAYLVAAACLSCESTEGTPPPSGVPDAQRDVAAIDATRDRSDDARGDASTDVTLSDVSEDAAADARDSSPEGASNDTADGDTSAGDGARSDADGAPEDRSLDIDAEDRSADDVTAEASDSTPTDGSTADQVDADAPISHPTCTVDQPCSNGECVGTSCDQAWNCFPHLAPHPCPSEIIPYCGCDGKTYYFPILCPQIPYLHAGECGDGVNCDRNDIRCAQAEPDCGAGKVASVVNGCYGACVPINSCRCLMEQECPGSGLYMCNPLQRCDFYPEAGTSTTR
jgi:hypothetical protein